MLPFDLDGYCDKLNLGFDARQIILEAFSSPPSRKVQSQGDNLNVIFPSSKMGVSIQGESGKVERHAIYTHEYHICCLGYVDQPPKIKLSFIRRDGKLGKYNHHPDFFVVYEDEAGWEEWKPRSKFEALAKMQPDRYALRNGEWYSPAGERYAKKLGLFYRLRCGEDVSRTLISNLTFLADYFRSEAVLPSEPTCKSILSAVNRDISCTLSKLQEEFDVDDLNTLIAKGKLYVDLERALLVEPEKVLVFTSKESVDIYQVIDAPYDPCSMQVSVIDVAAGTEISWNGAPWVIVNRGDTHTSLRPIDNGEQIVELPNYQFTELVNKNKITPIAPKPVSFKGEAKCILSNISPEDLQEAMVRHKAIEFLLNGRQGVDRYSHMPMRTRRHWRHLFYQAEAMYGDGRIGLIFKKPGRKPTPVVELPALQAKKYQHELEVIKEFYDDPRAQSISAVYSMYCAICERDGRIAVSEATFSGLVKNRDLYGSELSRKGRKGAYAAKPVIHDCEQEDPMSRHGDRPWEKGYIDSTTDDIEIYDPESRTSQRYTLMTLTDGYSRRCLVGIIAPGGPRTEIVMMLIRECVRLHGRLPQIICHDGGKEYRSTYFQTLMAWFRVELQKRPPGQSRFGSTHERFYGTIHSRLIHNLQGNTKLTKNVREVCKEFNPKNLAIWPYEDMRKELEFFLYEKYYNDEHSELMETPRQAYERGMRQFGYRRHTLITYDEDFILATMIPAKNAVAQVIRDRGVKVNYNYYWHSSFRVPHLVGAMVPVKYDPTNIGIIAALIDGTWVKCDSDKYYKKTKDMSERDLSLYSLREKSRKYLSQKRIREGRAEDGHYLLGLREKEADLSLAKEQDLADFLDEIIATEKLQKEAAATVEAKNDIVITPFKIEVYEDDD